MIPKPGHVFDREWEWSQLERFVEDGRPGTTLGIVSGRRRQGKSLLLQALAAATGGFYHEVIDGSEREILDDLGRKLGAHVHAPAPLDLRSSEEALAALLALGEEGRAVPVVLDEFPALAAAAPGVPSLLRNQLGEATRAARPARTRLLLCGSALRFMGGLLAGHAPLRGRAGLELVVPSFDYRLARDFWGRPDPALAVKVFAIVGGTPAYRREFVSDDVPRGPADFDPWVVRTLLNPALPIFREVRYLLAEDPAIGELALYASILAAIAAGESTSARIAGRLGRPATSLAHPLGVLLDAGFLRRERDAFHERRVHHEIEEPLVRFHHAILRPAWSELERPGRAAEVWARERPRFLAQVLGPTFERLCREWAGRHAAPETWGGSVHDVRRGRVSDPLERVTREIDVVVIGPGERILGLGEAKWGGRIGLAELERLRRLRQLLVDRGHPAAGARLALFGGGGFATEILRLARAEGLVLVDLERLYGGS